MRNRVLVIGIDSGTFDLITPWTEEGYLPNIARLINEGSWSELESTPLPLTGPAWTSFMTGKNPGKHGVFDFVRVTKDYKTLPINADDIDSKTIFEIVSQDKKKVISINVPITHPPQEVNGYMISGMPASDVSDGITFPEDAKERLPRDYLIIPKTVYEGDNEKEILDELDIMLKRQMEVVKDFIKEDWDLFMVVFFATDVVSHWFWKYHDKNHPLHRQEHEKYAGAILDIYQKVDESIGELLASIDSNTTVLVMSDHGVGPLHQDIFINNWLAKKGYLKFKKNLITRLKVLAHGLGWTLENLYSISQRLKLARKTVSMSEEGRNFLLKFLLSFSDVDWSRTKAYSMTNFGPIFINLKGREEQGIVEKGREYDELVNEIKDGLLQIKDPNGEHAIEKVFTKDELFHGKYFDFAPDIIYVPKDMKYTSNRYFEFGSNKLFGKPHRDMSGDHRYNGIFIARGDQIKEGLRFEGAKIYDLAPTILHLMEAGIPDDMDGRVLKEIFEEDSDIFLRDTEIIESKKAEKRNKRRISPEEEKRIKERLRGLGYTA